ncbi:Hypothetical predicted protein [Lecanosticta acicola]|uniref:Uncharacterized protein n=1 Tax=Lecanosticta acicola TaxID=111012 RepID=A0AAI8YZ92_9PEZI|nr:Hypothetical predicted protein [Lecanosticta acicola]
METFFSDNMFGGEATSVFPSPPSEGDTVISRMEAPIEKVKTVKNPTTPAQRSRRTDGRRVSEQDQNTIVKMERMYHDALWRALEIGVDLSYHPLIDWPDSRHGPWRKRMIRELEEGLKHITSMAREFERGLERGGHPDVISHEDSPWTERKPFGSWTRARWHEWYNSIALRNHGKAWQKTKQSPASSMSSSSRDNATPPHFVNADLDVFGGSAPSGIQEARASGNGDYSSRSVQDSQEHLVAYLNNGPRGLFLVDVDGSTIGYLKDGAFVQNGAVVASMRRGSSAQHLLNLHGAHVGSFKLGQQGPAFYGPVGVTIERDTSGSATLSRGFSLDYGRVDDPVRSAIPHQTTGSSCPVPSTSNSDPRNDPDTMSYPTVLDNDGVPAREQTDTDPPNVAPSETNDPACQIDDQCHDTLQNSANIIGCDSNASVDNGSATKPLPYGKSNLSVADGAGDQYQVAANSTSPSDITRNCHLPLAAGDTQYLVNGRSYTNEEIMSMSQPDFNQWLESWHPRLISGSSTQLGEAGNPSGNADPLEDLLNIENS